MAANKLTVAMNELRSLYRELESAEEAVSMAAATLPADNWDAYEATTIRLDDARNAILSKLANLTKWT